MATEEWPADMPIGTPTLSMLYRDARNPPKDPDVSFEGKTVVVTGCNTGLGLEAAIKFAQRGAAHLALCVRTEAKGEATKATILSRVPSYPSSSFSIHLVDYSSFASIKAFAKDISSTLPNIDVLLLNAGGQAESFTKTPEGWATDLQIDCLSPVLLATLLLPKLVETGKATGSPPHLVFTSSISWMTVNEAILPKTDDIDLLDHYNKPENFSFLSQYPVAKFLLQISIPHLQAAVASQPNAPIIVGCCPSGVATGLYDDFGFVMRTIFGVLMSVCYRKVEEGARTLVSAATLGEEAKGGFWKNDKINGERPPFSMGRLKELRESQWGKVRGVLEGLEPEVKEVLEGRRL